MAAGHSPIFACQTPISKPILIWERKPATDEKYQYGGVKSTDTHLRHVLYNGHVCRAASLVQYSYSVFIRRSSRGAEHGG